MALKDVTFIQNLLNFLNVLIFVAQNFVSPFFPLFFKYLGLSVFEMSLVRTFQVTVTAIVMTLSIYAMKLKNGHLWKAHFVCLSLLTSFASSIILAVCFYSGTNANLMKCGSFINHSESEKYSLLQETATLLNTKPVIDSAGGNHINLAAQLNSVSVSIPDGSIGATKHIFASNFYPDLKLQTAGIQNVDENVNKFSTKNGKNKYGMKSKKNILTQQLRQSSVSALKPLFSSPTTSSVLPNTAVNRFRATDMDDNLGDIFSVTEKSSGKEMTPQKKHKYSTGTKYQDHSEAMKYNLDPGIKNKTKINFRLLRRLIVNKLINQSLFTRKPLWKQNVQNMQATQTAYESIVIPTRPVKIELPMLITKSKVTYSRHLPGTDIMDSDNMTKFTSVSWQSAQQTDTTDYDPYTTPVTTVISTIKQSMPQNFAENHFKEIIKFLKNYKAHTGGNHGALSNGGIYKKPKNNQVGNGEKRARTRFQKQQYSKNNSVSSGILQNFSSIDTNSGSGIPQLLQHQVKREVFGAGQFKVPENNSFLLKSDYPYSGNVDQMPLLVSTGARKPELGNAQRGMSSVTTAHANRLKDREVEAVQVFSGTSRVVVWAVVLVAVYELTANTAAPCMLELWRQLSGQQLALRSPLQLVMWSVSMCVLMLLLMAANLPCQLQATIHCGCTAALFMLALVPALVALPPIAHRARPDKEASYMDDGLEPEEHLALMQTVTKLVSGFLTACSAEFILWHVASLGAFPLDYELLYCGYASLSGLAEAAVRWCRCDVHSELAGCALLGGHFLAASMLGNAWAALAVAPLGGTALALLWPKRCAGWWLGYGLGCVAGGALASAYGTTMLFLACAAACGMGCIFVVICWGMARCGHSHSYTHLLSAGEEPEEHEEDADPPVEVEDWLERALLEEEHYSKVIPHPRHHAN